MLKPREALNVGDEIELNARLTSPDGDMESIFYIKIVDPQKEEKKEVDKEPEKPDLPQLIKISKNEKDEWVQDNGEPWMEEGWEGGKSIIHIFPGDAGDQKVIDAIAINMDSHTLQRYLSKNKNQAKSETDIEYLRNQYISKVYLHGLFLYLIIDKLKQQDNDKNKYSKDDESSEELIAKIFMNYSDVLIHLDTNKEILASLSD